LSRHEARTISGELAVLMLHWLKQAISARNQDLILVTTSVTVKRGSPTRPDSRRLDAISCDIDQIYRQLDTLSAQLAHAGERIRLNTGFIRLLDHDATLSSAVRPGPEPGRVVSGNDLLAVIRSVEQAIPDAAHARCVALSVQGPGMEDVLLASAAYFRERLDTRGDGTTNDLWNHVDSARDQNLSPLFEDARIEARRATSGASTVPPPAAGEWHCSGYAVICASSYLLLLVRCRERPSH
jgi:hypothetical protein